MGKEIERKFLVKDTSYKKGAAGVLCAQGYINEDIHRLVRVRLIGDKGFLTIKGKNRGITRTEFEYEIPCEDAKELLQNFCTTFLVQKIRYTVYVGSTKWEVDEFLAENKGLVLAEVEINHEEEVFEKPDWVGEEVSNDYRYAGSSLAKFPYKKWELR